ncbi:MAG: hypothetical protein R3349_04605 [Geminicoccaceae bacterium]|nr:hypothetical protein [Geminicoccaceae bacterium]
MQTFDRAQAFADPAATFVSPEQVLEQPSLSLAERIAILRRWESQVADEPVAEEIGMAGSEPGLLDRILAALDHLESLSGDEPPADREHV